MVGGQTGLLAIVLAPRDDLGEPLTAAGHMLQSMRVGGQTQLLLQCTAHDKQIGKRLYGVGGDGER